MPEKDPYAEIAKPVDDTYANMGSGQTAPAEPSMLSKAGAVGKDLLIGGGRGIAGTTSNLDTLMSKIPGIGQWLTRPIGGNKSSAQTIAEEKQAAVPQNTTQAVGKGIEQAGEFLIPGAAEESGAARLATLLPRAGKAALPLAKLATSALSTGLLNKAQGGNFGTGALAGAGATLAYLRVS